MANLRVDHPDIMSFIKCKTKEGDISNFNISVAITDAFMEAYLSGSASFRLFHPRWDKETIINPKEIMDAIVDCSWRNGEPGVQFIDTVNRSGTVGHNKLFEQFNIGLEVSNPCGETFLLPNESCNLGAMNIYKYVVPFWDKGELRSTIKWKELEADVEYAVDFLNAIIDKSEAPIPAINKATKLSRKIGLGVMGLADTLSAMGIRYGSSDAIAVTKDIFDSLNRYARASSVAMDYKNATLTLVAPTGTTGVVAGASGGIEPHFRALYDRKSVKMGNLKIMPVSLLDFLRTRPEAEQRELLEELVENKGKFVKYGGKEVWPTSDQVTPDEHMSMLITVQSKVDNSVSKTINLPNSATREDIRNTIIRAWKEGVKGFTVYRDGSRDEQVLNEIKSEPAKLHTMPVAPTSNNASPSIECSSGCASCTCGSKPTEKRERPTKTVGETNKVKIGCGNLYVTVNTDESGPCEVFTNLGRSGGCPSQSEATARLISLALRSGVDVNEVIDQLKGIRCLSTIAGKSQGKQPDGTRVLSCPDAIGKSLEALVKHAEKISPQSYKIKDAPAWTPVFNGEEVIFKQLEPPVVYASDPNRCPRCAETLTLSEGCRICMACGFSKCG